MCSRNMSAVSTLHYESLTSSQKTQIENIMMHARLDRLKVRMESTDITFEDIDTVLQPVLNDSTETQLEDCKSWIIKMSKKCKSFGSLVSHYLLARAAAPTASFDLCLNIVHVFNGLLIYSKRKVKKKEASDLLMPLIKEAALVYCLAAEKADNHGLKSLQLSLEEWKSHHAYDPENILDTLDSPPSRLDRLVQWRQVEVTKFSHLLKDLEVSRNGHPMSVDVHKGDDTVVHTSTQPLLTQANIVDDYYDLNVPESPNTREIIDELVEHRFHYIAVSKTITASSLLTVRKNKGNKNEVMSTAAPNLKLPDLSSFLSDTARQKAQIRGKQLHLFTRLNIICDESCTHGDIKQILSHGFFSKEINKFDILSIQTISNDILTNLPKIYSYIDLVTVIYDSTMYKPTPKVWKQFMRYDMCLEFLISPMISSQSARVGAISRMSALTNQNCAKNILFSSGATNVWDVRTPIALTCLARMLGISPQASFMTVKENGRKVLQRALVRTRTVVGAVAIMTLQKKPGVLSVEVVGSDSKIQKASPMFDNKASKNASPKKERSRGNSMSSEPPCKKLKL